jgi:4-diphosphocytidyl-2-C-methyl-D-erythritol kinase
MDLRRDDFKRIARAPAKLNLFLEVLGRRADGFHELETLMVPVRLFDSLSLTPTRPARADLPGEIRLRVACHWPVGRNGNSEPVSAGPDNLIHRALTLLQQRSGTSLGALVELDKRIPVAAGLGGGSSDAATALRLANRAWQLNWSDDRLRDLAGELGSDIPFFVSRGAAVCRGKGERIEPLPPLAPLHFVIVKPPVGLSTSDVYEALDARQNVADRESNSLGQLAVSLMRGSWINLRREMFNCLQQAAASLSPWVAKIRDAFSRCDFLAHQLSGSGSAYFGVCRHAAHARRLATVLRSRQLGLVYATRSCQ